MKKADPGLSKFFDKAAGYAVFPDIGKGGFIVGGRKFTYTPFGAKKK